MDEALKCPHGAVVYALPDGEPYFPDPCPACLCEAKEEVRREGTKTLTGVS